MLTKAESVKLLTYLLTHVKQGSVEIHSWTLTRRTEEVPDGYGYRVKKPNGWEDVRIELKRKT